MNAAARFRMLPAMLRAHARALRMPGDPTTPEGRAHERHRRASLSALMAVIAKLVSIATMFITVPITIHYLGPERYGMWMIMSSLIAMLAFADLGIGNGVLNAVSAAHGRDDVAAMQEGISSGMAVLTLVAGLILIGFAIAYPHVAWHELFNVRSPLARAEAGPAVAVFVLCFAIAVPVTVVQRVEIGLQRSFLASAWVCCGSLLSLVAVLVAVWSKAGLPILVAALTGAPLVANIGNGLIFFGLQRPDLRPRLRAVRRRAAHEVMEAGLLFFALQVAAAASYNSQPVIIAQILGAQAVPQYSVPERLFSLIGMTVTMALGPLWPAYREAITRGDVDWTRRMLRRSITSAVGYAAMLAIPLVIVSPFLIRLWVGHAVTPPILLLIALGVWKIVEAGGIALSMFLNGAHIIGSQVWAAISTAIFTVGLAIFLVYTIGVAGAVWAMILAFLLFSVLPYSVLVPRVIRSLRPSPVAIYD